MGSEPWSRRDLRGCLREQRGNTLVLFPVAVLIVFGLGALALDSATLFLGQRRLADLAAAVAGDAVAAIDRAGFYGGNGHLADVALAQDAADARRAQLVALANATADRSFEQVDCTVTVGAATATATCTAVSRPILAPLLPGMRAVHQLRSTETAEGRVG